MQGRRKRESTESYLAYGLVVAKEEADRREDELANVPRWRFRRRSELQRTAEETREREQSMLSVLAGAGAGAGE